MSDIINDSTVGGFKVSEFSQATLDLQSTFCCNNTNTDKILKFFNNGPAIYLGGATIWNSAPFNFNKWSQVIKGFNSKTNTVPAGTALEVEVESTFIFVKICWPTTALNSKKLVECFLKGTYTLDPNTGKDFIYESTYDTLIEQKYLLDDVLILNLGQMFKGVVKINNPSPYAVSFSVLEAGAFDIVSAEEPPSILTSTIYWGTTTKTDSYTSDDIIGLQYKQKFQSVTKIGAREMNAEVGEYILMAYPQSWGVMDLQVEGYELVCTDESPYAVTVTNPATGQNILYNVWRSEHSNLGLTTVLTQ